MVADAFTLVGLWRANFSNVRSHLADLFFVEPAHFNLADFRLNIKGDPSRSFELHRVRKTQIQHQVGAAHLSAVAHAFHVQQQFKTFADAGHHII